MRPCVPCGTTATTSWSRPGAVRTFKVMGRVTAMRPVVLGVGGRVEIRDAVQGDAGERANGHLDKVAGHPDRLVKTWLLRAGTRLSAGSRRWRVILAQVPLGRTATMS